MEYRKFGNTYILRIDTGEEIIETIKIFAAKNGVKLASISGIGAVKEAIVGLYDINTKKFIATEHTGDFEIASLTGNITTRDGEEYIHVHACICDRNNRAYGGHLSRGVVSATCEIFITCVDGEVERHMDSAIGLNLLNFRGINYW